MNEELWRKRIRNRNDMTSRLTHLTRGESDDAAFANLWKILSDRKLIAGCGFVVEGQKVVCFQEAPLYAIEENLFFEEKLRETGDQLRYSAFGLRFNKGALYQKGTRPVIYGEKEELKGILNQSAYWRIVNHNLQDTTHLIDWSHEREWRHLGDLDFEYREIEVIVKNNEYYRKFIEKCIDENKKDLLREINGVITLNSVVL